MLWPLFLAGYARWEIISGAMNYPVFMTKAVIFRETWELPTILAPKKAGLTDASHCHDLFPELLLLPAPILYPFTGFLSQPSY